MLKVIIISALVLGAVVSTVVMYCCCVVAGREDEIAEKYLREKENTSSSDCNKRVQSDNY